MMGQGVERVAGSPHLGMDLLYVDHLDIAQTMLPALESDVLAPVSAASGLDALKRLSTEAYDAIVVPDRLPDMSLAQFAERTDELAPTATLIVLGDRDDAASDAVYISRSVSGRTLVDRLQSVAVDRHIDGVLDRHERLRQELLDVAFALAADPGGSAGETLYDGFVDSEVVRPVWVGRYDPSTEEYVGHSPVEVRLTGDELADQIGGGASGSVDEAVQTGTATLIAGGARRRSNVDASTSTRPRGADSEGVAVVPLAARENPSGIVILESKHEDGFEEADRRTLESFGTLLGRVLGGAESGQSRGAGDPERIARLIDVLAHELRNPLTIASSYLEIGREHDDDDSFDRVADAHDRIEDILETAVSMAAGGGVDQVEHVEVAEIALDVWQDLDTGGADLKIEEPVETDADPGALERILSNLFRNAIDHGGPEVSVTIGALADREGFFVEDDGPGISEDERDRVFEWGYSTSESGLGIGLGFVRELAESHGWRVSAHGASGGGTRFEIEVEPAPRRADGGETPLSALFSSWERTGGPNAVSGGPSPTAGESVAGAR